MANRDWWRGAVSYQSYPRSYADSDGDGIGDLAGIERRLAYVASLGVDAVWPAPFFRSPMKDFGDDVSDYCDVDPMFGTLEDRLPKPLSGGQRQRVSIGRAIGRAIVREPDVFLFDEPLSNLDASLRVQTRLEIARLHHDIGRASMIYVTHDQVEAMTLADKMERLGESSLLCLDVAPEAPMVTLRLEGHATQAEGERITLRRRSEQCHLFDRNDNALRRTVTLPA